MSTLNEVMAQIEELKTIKADFKNAIIAQGGEITDNTPFTHYPYIINNLETGYRFGISIDDLIGDVDENGELQAPQTRELNLAFNLLERISGDENCSAIRLCTAPYSIKTISFPDLVDISSSYGLCYAFYGCSSITSVDLSSLQSVGSYGLYYAFYGCSSITSVSFPALRDVMVDSFSGSVFSNCPALTEIHFRADMQSTIEAMTGYDTKWGATNATVYFDL